VPQKQAPRDPHADNDLIGGNESEPAARSGRSGDRQAEEITSRDEEKSASGADPEPTRDTKVDRIQPTTPKRPDHEGAQTVDSNLK
jgi:hypothetical protein